MLSGQDPQGLGRLDARGRDPGELTAKQQMKMPIALRPARPEDFHYCANLYFAGMDKVIRELSLDRNLQIKNFRQQWDVAQVRLITLAGADIGWLQSRIDDDAVFLAQIFVEATCQRQGFGTEAIRSLINEALPLGRAVTPGVVKSNPAQRLYQRLGFRITHDDDRKFYMRLDGGSEAPNGKPG
jgi:ribosomal protein S18 acetylase RimI-like enzyme